MRILLIENEAGLADQVRHDLEAEGYTVNVARAGSEDLSVARHQTHDLMVLNTTLPEADGSEALSALRQEGFTAPALVLRARGNEAHTVLGFQLDIERCAATPPSGLLELVEGVGVLLQPSERQMKSDPRRLSFGNVVIDTAGHRVTRNGRAVSLPPRAYDFLLALIRNEGRAVTRQELLREGWGYRNPATRRTVDSNIYLLRQGLEENPTKPRHIITVWNVGYRFQR